MTDEPTPHTSSSHGTDPTMAALWAQGNDQGRSLGDMITDVATHVMHDVERGYYSDDAVGAAILALPQMVQIKAFLLCAARHAAQSGMEKNEMKYLEAMGLDKPTSEWVLS